ncbi:hypothetical protein Agub_g9531, partial [Astrephomene gubernaculifera]
LAAGGVRVTHISFAAYSFGGLIARYAAGKLLSCGFFRRVAPVNFLTIASPHLGCWEHPSSMTHLAYNSILPWTLSRTGRQLLLADRWLHPEGLPLLAVMARPDCAFHAALAAFAKRVLLADIRNDRTVPYTTAAITAVNPYLPHVLPYKRSAAPGAAAAAALRRFGKRTTALPYGEKEVTTAAATAAAASLPYSGGSGCTAGTLAEVAEDGGDAVCGPEAVTDGTGDDGLGDAFIGGTDAGSGGGGGADVVGSGSGGGSWGLSNGFGLVPLFSAGMGLVSG